MVPAYYDIDNDLRSDDDMADLKQVLQPPTCQDPSSSSSSLQCLHATLALYWTRP